VFTKGAPYPLARPWELTSRAQPAQAKGTFSQASLFLAAHGFGRNLKPSYRDGFRGFALRFRQCFQGGFTLFS
jgi:hypothetical protein